MPNKKLSLSSKLFFVTLVVFSLVLGCSQTPEPKESSVLLGTEWTKTYYSDFYKRQLSFTIEFASNGKLITSNENDTTPDNDRWEHLNEVITLRINDSYAVYTAKLTSETSMSGQATNRKNETWSWSAIKN